MSMMCVDTYTQGLSLEKLVDFKKCSYGFTFTLFEPKIVFGNVKIYSVQIMTEFLIAPVTS